MPEGHPSVPSGNQLVFVVHLQNATQVFASPQRSWNQSWAPSHVWRKIKACQCLLFPQIHWWHLFLWCTVSAMKGSRSFYQEAAWPWFEIQDKTGVWSISVNCCKPNPWQYKKEAGGKQGAIAMERWHAKTTPEVVPVDLRAVVLNNDCGLD